MNQTGHSVPIETALRLVADERCRAVLARLLESESRAVELNALVTYVASENPPPAEDGRSHAEHVLLDLHHNRLPKLDAAGLVEYDARSETVRYRPNERVERVHQFVTAELE